MYSESTGNLQFAFAHAQPINKPYSPNMYNVQAKYWVSTGNCSLSTVKTVLGRSIAHVQHVIGPVQDYNVPVQCQ